MAAKGTEETVQFGLSNVHVALAYETVTTGGTIVTTYGTPKAWTGAVHMTLNTKATSADTYADNGVWYVSASNPGYDGSYESMGVPDWALEDLLGRLKDDNGAIFESAEDRAKPFALMFETDSDTYPIKYVYYKCQLSNPSGDWETKTDSTTPKTATANLRVMPRAEAVTVKGESRHVIGAMVDATVDATAYDGFYSAVYEPYTTPPTP